MAIGVYFPLSWAAQPEAWGPTLLGADFLYRILSPTGLSKMVSKLNDFLSSPTYIIVQSPTQYLPITGHRDVSLPLFLEWHVWLSSSGNNCHAVQRSLCSCASVYLYCVILPCPILSAKPAYANGICNIRVFGMACLAGSKVNIQVYCRNWSPSLEIQQKTELVLQCQGKHIEKDYFCGSGNPKKISSYKLIIIAFLVYAISNWCENFC